MTDRELLELAALAYWGAEIDDVCSVCWLEEEQAVGYTHADNQDHNGCDVELVWNPITDDGDVFRLAVKLNLLDAPRMIHERDVLMFTKGVEKLEATRRAIVRAAAEIGKAMQQEHRRTTP